MSDQQISQFFQTNLKKGISQATLAERKRQYGINELIVEKEEPFLIIFLRQFQNPLIYILLIAASIIFLIGNRLDAFIISGVLLFNATIGTIQEGRTKKILSALKHFLPQTCLVIRDGNSYIINIEDLCPGDLIVVQEGEQVPADARIIEENNLMIDEAILTGESSGIEKISNVINEKVNISDQRNMIFKGTYVLTGNCRAIVTAIGSHAEIGKIHLAVKEIETETPLQKELEKLSHWVLLIILLICVGLFIIGLSLGKTISELLVMLTALFICVVPEGLPVVFTVVLVTGAYHLAKKFVLIKHLHAVEGLGRVEVIVLDKTGTLTRNELMVLKFYAETKIYNVTGQGYSVEGQIKFQDKEIEKVEDENLKIIEQVLSLLSSYKIVTDEKDQSIHIKGDPTDIALSILGKKLNKYLKQQATIKKIYDLPFSSAHRYHLIIYEDDGYLNVVILGAPETIAQFAKQTEEDASALNKLLQDGLRIISCAHYKLKKEELICDDYKLCLEKNLKGKLKIIALFGLQDSIRSEVAQIITKTRNAGIDVAMATGDHLKTAMFVARETGILRESDKVIEGQELEKLSDEQLLKELDKIKVFARVTPTDKLRIINLYHKEHKIVAMTGDGVNDAPSLVAADIGIAMGKIGTEVAQQASDIILLDDSFNSIVYAIEQGRHIFYTLRRVVLYFFATNFGEILVVLFAFILQLEIPILPAQILWLNLVTDGFLDMALAMEPMEKNLLQKKWISRAIHKGLIDFKLLSKVIYMAIPMGLGCIWLFWKYYEKNLAEARTMTLICMAMFQWYNAWNCRSEELSIFQLGFFANYWLILATAFVLMLQILVVYTPFMQIIFKTVPIHLNDWFLIFLISSSIIVFEEVRKLVARKYFKE